MAEFRLSPHAIEGLRPLLSLPFAAVDDLASQLGKLSVKLSIQDDVQAVVNQSYWMADLEPADRDAIAESVTGVHFLRVAGGETSIDQLCKGIVASIGEEDATKADEVRSKVERILSIPVLQASIKAVTLIEDYERIYISSRIMTDVRPVFDEDLSKPLLASLLLHTIKLTSRVGGKNESYYMIADNDDVRALIRRLERSLAKAESLKRIIKDSLSNQFGPSLTGLND